MQELSWLVDVLKQVPALSVLVLLTIHFLKSNAALSKNFSKTAEEMHKEFANSARECHVVQTKAVEAIAHNTEALRDLKDEIKSLNGVVAHSVK